MEAQRSGEKNYGFSDVAMRSVDTYNDIQRRLQSSTLLINEVKLEINRKIEKIIDDYDRDPNTYQYLSHLDGDQMNYEL